MSEAAVPDTGGAVSVENEERYTLIGLAGWYFAIPLERSAGTIEAVPLTRVPMAPE